MRVETTNVQLTVGPGVGRDLLLRLIENPLAGIVEASVVILPRRHPDYLPAALSRLEEEPQRVISGKER